MEYVPDRAYRSSDTDGTWKEEISIQLLRLEHQRTADSDADPYLRGFLQH